MAQKLEAKNPLKVDFNQELTDFDGNTLPWEEKKGGVIVKTKFKLKHWVRQILGVVDQELTPDQKKMRAGLIRKIMEADAPIILKVEEAAAIKAQAKYSRMGFEYDQCAELLLPE